MRSSRALAVVMVFTVVEAFAGLSLKAQDTVHSVNSLSLRLSCRALSAPETCLNSKRFWLTTQRRTLKFHPLFWLTAQFICIGESSMFRNSTPTPAQQRKRFAASENILMSGVFCLRPGQRLELLGVQIPKELLRGDGKGQYRVSLRFSPGMLISSEDTLQGKPLYYNLISNEMNVNFSAF